MILLRNHILVEELKDDMKVNGLVIKYDDTNHFMFCKVIAASKEVEDYINQIGLSLDNAILVTKRVSKVPFLENYIISKDDVLMIMNTEEYKDFISGGLINGRE